MPTSHPHNGQSQSPSRWQDAFAALLPQIEVQLKFAFHSLDPEAREEALQEGRVNCLVRYEQLARLGRTEVATARSLARYAIRQIRSGRTIATPLNGRDPLSLYARLRHGIRLERLDQSDPQSEEWINVAVASRRASIPEQVALRIDTKVWLRGCSRRTRQIARDLTLGWKPGELARKYRLSPGRISQIRRQMFESWCALQAIDGIPAFA